MTEAVSENGSDFPIEGERTERERSESSCSYCSVHSTKKRPSLRGSAKFRRITSGKSHASIEDKMLVLNSLLTDSLLITEFPAHNSREIEKSKDDDDDDNDTIKEEFGEDLDSDDGMWPSDGRVSKDDYDTDLDMDFDEWINEEKREIEQDKLGEKKYIHICNSTGVIPASYFLEHIQDKEFVMKFHGLGPLGAKAIAWPLQSNKKIEKLNLEGNWIEGDGAVYLAKMLKNNYYITELYLGENRMGNQGAEAMSELLYKNDMITAIDLSGNDIDDYGGEKLCRSLLKNSTVKHLLLSNNNFEERAATWFREVLITNETLETMDLSWNHLRTRGAVAIAEGVQENYGLRVLLLGMNGFGQDGAEAIGKALKNNRTLLELDLSHNRITQEGAEHIASGLQHNDTLRMLMAGSNPLGCDGPLALLNAVSKNDLSEITMLDLTDVLVTKDFHELQEKLEMERILTVKRGNVVGEIFNFNTVTFDPLAEFRRDPMSKLLEYTRAAGYRLVDLFKEFDSDGNKMISKDEFILGVKRSGIQISVRQLEVLIKRLDKDRNGQIDFSELLRGEEEYRQAKRDLKEKADKEGRSVSSTALMDEAFLAELNN